MPRRSHAETLARIHKAVSTNDETILTAEEGDLLRELQLAFELLLSGDYTQQKVVDTLKQRFTIGDVTATARIRDAKQVFGDVTKGQRAMDAHIAYMRAEKVYMLAMGLDESRVEVKVDKELLALMAPDERIEFMMNMQDQKPRVNLEVALQAINTMVKIRGLDKEESQLIDPAVLERDTTISLNPQAKKLIAALLGQGVVNLSALFADVPDAQLLLNTPSHDSGSGEAEG